MPNHNAWTVYLLTAVVSALMLPAQACCPGNDTESSAQNASHPTTKSEVPARNLILISIDTLRADHLGSYGYHRNTTPRLDKRAAQGTLFLNAISSSSWTVPAHVTLLTGLEPIAQDLYRYPATGALPADVMTLAAVLKEQGFRTAAFTGGGFVSEYQGFDIGFQRFRSNGRRFEKNLPAAREWVTSLKKGDRFFLFLHGFNTHKPYKPPAPYDRRFSGNYRGDYDVADFQPYLPRPSPEDLEYVISQYDGEIAYVDDLLGDFLDELEQRGILRQTLLLVVSDHGDEMYEHGSVDHIHTLYDELLRVPLIFVGPGVAAQVIADQIGLIDVFPSVCDLLGVTPDAPVQGKSWAAILRGEDPSTLDVRPSQVVAYAGFSEFPYNLESLRTDEWKLVVWKLSGMRDVHLRWLERRPAYTYKFRNRTDDFVELFDLRKDPGEQNDVSSEHPAVVEKLTKLLEQRKRESERFRITPEEITTTDRAYIKSLRALGYIE